MVMRAMALAAGVAGGVGMSQFPEFSQQYAQRLGGAVDELERQVQRYEMDAQKVGMSLPELIDQLGNEGELSKTQAGNMSNDIVRRDRLEAALQALQDAGPFSRLRLSGHMLDRDIAARAYENFKPAVPATFEGAAFAGGGFFAGWAGFAGLLAFLRGGWAVFAGLFRRKPKETTL